MCVRVCVSVCEVWSGRIFSFFASLSLFLSFFFHSSFSPFSPFSPSPSSARSHRPSPATARPHRQPHPSCASVTSRPGYRWEQTDRHVNIAFEVPATTRVINVEVCVCVCLCVCVCVCVSVCLCVCVMLCRVRARTSLVFTLRSYSSHISRTHHRRTHTQRHTYMLTQHSVLEHESRALRLITTASCVVLSFAFASHALTHTHTHTHTHIHTLHTHLTCSSLQSTRPPHSSSLPSHVARRPLLPGGDYRARAARGARRLRAGDCRRPAPAGPPTGLW